MYFLVSVSEYMNIVLIVKITTEVLSKIPDKSTLVLYLTCHHYQQTTATEWLLVKSKYKLQRNSNQMQLCSTVCLFNWFLTRDPILTWMDVILG